MRHYLRDHVGSKDNVLACFFCGLTLDGLDKLEYHTRMHTKERLDFCKNFKINVSELKQHNQRVHSDKRTFPCSVRKRRFKTKSNLKSHTKVHLNEVPFKCVASGKGFRTIHGIKDHKKAHLQEKSFPCTRCDLAFIREVDMLNHYLKIHAGCDDNVLTCLFCGFKVTSIVALENHTNKHTMERPYNCRLCTKTFKINSGLKRHMDTTHKNAGMIVEQRQKRVIRQKVGREKMKAVKQLEHEKHVVAANLTFSKLHNN